jgi:hypothetical protein
MATSIQFRTVDVPGAAQTEVNGVNNPGVVAGTYLDQNGSFGFIQDGSKLVTLDYPGTSGVTTVASINNPGTVIGYYTDANGVSHGWIRSSGGSFSPINDPVAGSAADTEALPLRPRPQSRDPVPSPALLLLTHHKQLGLRCHQAGAFTPA